MKCTRCEELLLERAEGALDAESAVRMERHLDDCPSCAGLAMLIESDRRGELVMPAEFAETVIASTSAIDPLARAMRQLERDLPALASMETDDDFVADVMTATVVADRNRLVNRIRRGLADFWERAVQRPRLALESGYVAALVLLLLFGLPASPLASVPERALRQLNTEGGPMRVITTSVEQVGELGRSGWTRAGELLTGKPEPGAPEERSSLGTFRDWLAASLGRFGENIGRVLEAGLEWISRPWRDDDPNETTTWNPIDTPKEKTDERIRHSA